MLWWEGDGLCLFAKTLERGRFIRPMAESSTTVALSRAQLSMLQEPAPSRPIQSRPGRSWAGGSCARVQVCRPHSSVSLIGDLGRIVPGPLHSGRLGGRSQRCHRITAGAVAL